MLSGISGISFDQNPYIAVLAAQRTQSTGASAAISPAAAIPAAQPEKPVQPVSPVRSVPETAPVQGETGLVRRWQNSAASAAGRSRMEYLDADALAKLSEDGPAANSAAQAKAAYGSAQAMGMQLKGRLQQAETALAGLEKREQEGLEGVSENKSAREVMEESECETCKERKYQDGSDDPGVSFKTAAHISPEMSAATVRGHEMEHVTREQAEAEREGRKVVNQSVSYQTSICPECGRAYVSGGTTRTTTMADRDPFAVGMSDRSGKNGGFSAVI